MSITLSCDNILASTPPNPNLTFEARDSITSSSPKVNVIKGDSPILSKLPPSLSLTYSHTRVVTVSYCTYE